MRFGPVADMKGASECFGVRDTDASGSIGVQIVLRDAMVEGVLVYRNTLLADLIALSLH